MAYAFDKINKYLDKKTKDESEELYRRPATRSQTAGTDHDFKSLNLARRQPVDKRFDLLRGNLVIRYPVFLGDCELILMNEKKA